jgi:hypothetical protein
LQTREIYGSGLGIFSTLGFWETYRQKIVDRLGTAIVLLRSAFALATLPGKCNTAKAKDQKIVLAPKKLVTDLKRAGYLIQ